MITKIMIIMMVITKIIDNIFHLAHFRAAWTKMNLCHLSKKTLIIGFRYMRLSSLVSYIWGYPHWFWICEAILSPTHWFRYMYCEWLSSTHYLQLSRMYVGWRCHFWTSVPLSLSYKYIVCWDRAFLQHIFDIFGSTSGSHNCFQIITIPDICHGRADDVRVNFFWPV